MPLPFPGPIRRHTDGPLYHSPRSGQLPDFLIPGRTWQAYDADAVMHIPTNRKNPVKGSRLAGLTGLRVLWLAETPVDDAEVAELQRRRPELEIVR